MTGGDIDYRDKGVWAYVVHRSDIISGRFEGDS
jgi:hypothetical protein